LRLSTKTSISLTSFSGSTASSSETGKVFAQVKIIYIDPLPIKIADKKTQQPFINLVATIIEKSSELSILNSRLPNLIIRNTTISNQRRANQN